jgi:glycosyltransferase involved in cell wall biosynthesis
VLVATSGRVFEAHVGGNSRYAMDLYRNLPACGVELMKLRPRSKFRLPDRPGARYALAEAAWSAGRFARSPDILHYPADTGPVCNGRVPIVTTIHGIASHHISGVRTPVREAIWRRRVSLAVRASRRIITVSNSSAADLMDVFGINKEDLDIIYHGIDHERFNITDTSDNEILAPLSLPERFVLYLGNLDPRKNIERLVACVTFAKDVFRDCPLIIAGKAAWGANEILSTINEAPHVRYLGQVPEEVVAPLMRRATVFAFPSLYEGFGFPVLEAMACGTPVVTSARGSLSELASGAALIVDPLNIESIAESIVSLIGDESQSESIRQYGLERSAQFTWAESARLHKVAFTKAIG